jgi:hypothetical protein
MMHSSRLPVWTVLATLAALLPLLTGCATSESIAVRSPPSKALSAQDADTLKGPLSGFLRTLGYSLESESHSIAVREHGEYWKGLPTTDAVTLVELWYRMVATSKFEVRLMTDTQGLTVSVWCGDFSRRHEVEADAGRLRGFLQARFPGYAVAVHTSHPSSIEP